MSLDGHSIQVQLWASTPLLECWGIQGWGLCLMGDRGWACACWEIWGWGLCLLGDQGGACVCWGRGRGL